MAGLLSGGSLDPTLKRSSPFIMPMCLGTVQARKSRRGDGWLKQTVLPMSTGSPYKGRTLAAESCRINRKGMTSTIIVGHHGRSLRNRDTMGSFLPPFEADHSRDPHLDTGSVGASPQGHLV